jgi:hypothetical protein
MKWIADWEYVLGVNLLNPHGFHYTFEGARKRDWPPSMFYQYPWWPWYGEFSAYISRISELLSGGRHVAKVAVLWPINAMFAAYLPQTRTPQSQAVEQGLNVLTDTLLRLHHDFDYLDEEVLATAGLDGGRVRVADEDYELVLVPPMGHVRAATVEALERFAAGGGKVLGVLQAPSAAFGPDGMEDVQGRMATLLGTPGGPGEAEGGFGLARRDHPAGGAGAFLAGDLAVLSEGPGPARDHFAEALDGAVGSLITPDVEISNPEVFSLHRRRDGRDLWFLVNTTFEAQAMRVRLPGHATPVLWDPSTGEERAAAAEPEDGWTAFDLTLPPVGSVFVVTGAHPPVDVRQPQPPAAEAPDQGAPHPQPRVGGAPDQGAPHPQPRVAGVPDQGAPHPQPRVPGAPEREGSPQPEQVRAAVHNPPPEAPQEPRRGAARSPSARSSRSARASNSPVRRSPAGSGVTRYSSRRERLATARRANSSRSAPSRRSRLAAPASRIQVTRRGSQTSSRAMIGTAATTTPSHRASWWTTSCWVAPASARVRPTPTSRPNGSRSSSPTTGSRPTFCWISATSPAKSLPARSTRAPGAASCSTSR